jgi:small conductance mechanosensitive channel
MILFEDMIAVGDVVEVGGQGGLVEAVTIRNVRLRDLAGTVHIIPFSAISTVSNLTKDYSYYVFDVGVAYREDTDHVVAVLKGLGAELESDPDFTRLILQPLEILGVDSFADSAVIIKARFKTRPIQQWNVGREFNRRMKKRFDELGIEIPFPHQTLYFGVDKEGNAPAAHVQISRHHDVGESDPALEIVANPQ